MLINCFGRSVSATSSSLACPNERYLKKMVTLALEKVYYSTLWKVRAIVGEVEAGVAVEVQIGVDILRGVKVKAGVEAPKKVLAIEEVVH